MENNELFHHGVKGMRWGVRRARKRTGSEDSIKVKKIRQKSIDEMSNQELRDANNRLQLERQYKDLTRKKSKGKQAVQTFVKGAATITAVAAAAKTYQKYGNLAVDKIGDYVVRNIKL